MDEALQFSPFSSIVPFGPSECYYFSDEIQRLIFADIIPIPNSNLPGSQSPFSTSKEHRISRQSLAYLDEELSRTQGQSSIAQRSKNDLKAYLNPDVITDL